MLDSNQRPNGFYMLIINELQLKHHRRTLLNTLGVDKIVVNLILGLDGFSLQKKRISLLSSSLFH